MLDNGHPWDASFTTKGFPSLWTCAKLKWTKCICRTCLWTRVTGMIRRTGVAEMIHNRSVWCPMVSCFFYSTVWQYSIVQDRQVPRLTWEVGWWNWLYAVQYSTGQIWLKIFGGNGLMGKGKVDGNSREKKKKPTERSVYIQRVRKYWIDIDDEITGGSSVILKTSQNLRNCPNSR